MLMIVGAVLCLVGTLWITINAFRESILWGIGALLLAPVTLIFAILHFGENKIPILLYVLGLALVVAGIMTAPPVDMPAA